MRALAIAALILAGWSARAGTQVSFYYNPSPPKGTAPDRLAEEQVAWPSDCQPHETTALEIGKSGLNTFKAKMQVGHPAVGRMALESP